MKTVRLHIRRTDENGTDAGLQTYEVPTEPGDTVLRALQHIYSAVDSTLAFRYSCRFKNCGLCGVRVSGRSRLACLLPLEDEMTVEPLSNLPVIRDLVVDRRPLFDELRNLKLFPIAEGKVEKSQDDLSMYYKLASCLECLCCHSECTAVGDGEGFAGPFVMVKLAQLHFHPRDGYDRQGQARELGVERCLNCRGCSCPYGIDISQDIIRPLLAQRKPRRSLEGEHETER